jgi:hypothetical protein
MMFFALSKKPSFLTCTDESEDMVRTACEV